MIAYSPTNPKEGCIEATYRPFKKMTKDEANDWVNAVPAKVKEPWIQFFSHSPGGMYFYDDRGELVYEYEKVIAISLPWTRPLSSGYRHPATVARKGNAKFYITWNPHRKKLSLGLGAT